MERSSDPHRRRMPWTAEKECVPGVVHSSKEKMVLDGARRVDVDCVDRASQVYPLEALRAAVAACEYNTSPGRTFLKRPLRQNPMYRAMGLLQGVPGGDARRGRHQHRHSFHCHGSNAARANTPCGFSGVKCAVPFAVIVPHPRASMQTSLSMHVSVDCGHTPMIDAAGTAAHCWCFWHDCCTAPAAGGMGLGTRTQQNKFNQMVLAALSTSRLTQRPTHTTEHRNRRDREGIDGVSGHQFSFLITPGQATVGINDNTIHQQ
ncbi:hypothetical protein TcBrA4_0110490 [Trypanosoma cruzi]|nr:hypothetical protein TcBrA4_0110490 [Trypanosoma cruzi]